MGHGSSGSTNLSGSRDPLTHDFVFFRHCRDLRYNLSHNVSLISLLTVVSTEYFVAVMMFDFESTST